MDRDTLTVREAREQLPTVLDGFRHGDTEPVFIGAYRRQEAVLISAQAYRNFIARRADALEQALASVRLEGLEVEDNALAIMHRWQRGEFSDQEVTAQLVDLYRRHDN